MHVRVPIDVLTLPFFSFSPPQCLAGVLAGALVSGVQLAVSMSNTGGAWDNAKKVRSSQSSVLFCALPLVLCS